MSLALAPLEIALILFYVPATRATRPRWMLEELGIPHELHRLDPKKGENQTPEYLALNPSGKVPSLVDGEVKIFESAAIVMYLADKYPEKGFAPAPGAASRALYNQWMSYAITTLEQPAAEYGHHTSLRNEGLRLPALADEAKKNFARAVLPAEQQLGKTPFILGDSFSAADIMLGGTLAWARSLKLLEGCPNTLAYVARLVERPAYRKMRAD